MLWQGWYLENFGITEDIQRKKAEEVAKEFQTGIVLIDETAKEPKPEIKCKTCGRVLTDFDLFMKFCPLCMKSLEEKE